jgi:hypothetical protein
MSEEITSAGTREMIRAPGIRVGPAKREQQGRREEPQTKRSHQPERFWEQEKCQGDKRGVLGTRKVLGKDR